MIKARSAPKIKLPNIFTMIRSKDPIFKKRILLSKMERLNPRLCQMRSNIMKGNSFKSAKCARSKGLFSLLNLMI